MNLYIKHVCEFSPVLLLTFSIKQEHVFSQVPNLARDILHINGYSQPIDTTFISHTYHRFSNDHFHSAIPMRTKTHRKHRLITKFSLDIIYVWREDFEVHFIQTIDYLRILYQKAVVPDAALVK